MLFGKAQADEQFYIQKVCFPMILPTGIMLFHLWLPSLLATVTRLSTQQYFGKWIGSSLHKFLPCVLDK